MNTKNKVKFNDLFDKLSKMDNGKFKNAFTLDSISGFSFDD